MKIRKDSHLIESCLDSETIWQGRLLHVVRDQVKLPDGTDGVREYIKHPGAVVIIPELPNGDLVFERQYRYPVGRVMLEFPAGKIDPDEPPLLTAQRELLEETGYTAEEWTHLATMHPTIGYANEAIDIFLARGLRDTGSRHLDEGEFVDIVIMGLEQAMLEVRFGRLTDGKTLSALLWAEKIISGTWIV